MTNNGTGARRRRPGRTAAGILVLSLCLSAAAADSPFPGADRFGLLVEALDAESSSRERILGSIDNELRGPEAAQMRAALRAGLREGGLLIRLGSAEALAMHADPSDVPLFRSILGASGNVVLKTAMIRLLPAFALGNRERARFQYIRAVASGDGRLDPQVAAALRSPPFTRRGRLDPGLVRLRREIAAAIAGQLDPIGAMIGHIADPRLAAEARGAVRKHVAGALGADPANWRAVWDGHAADIPLQHAGEIAEIITVAVQTIADFGEPPDRGILDEIGGLVGPGDALAAQAGLAALADLCAAVSGLAMSFEPDGPPGGEWTGDERAWLAETRRRAAALRLFAAGAARRALADPASPVVRAAVNALGAAIDNRNMPPGDPELAAMVDGAVDELGEIVLSAGLPDGLRAAVTAALGRSGTDGALDAVLETLASPYSSPDSGRGGLAVAEACVASALDIAGGSGSGRDRARTAVLALLESGVKFPAANADAPPVTMGHLVLWRLQRAARSGDISFEPGFWRSRLGWDG
ncbi:MAG: hypothetical protein LBJ46_07015 [Planctomycetota bacterium]|jgi:hypothetical protein|nr:hypothetical protein [Planctomycetota bacterium]